MRRGEVWYVDFSSAFGGEIKKTRPAVIVSNDSANAALNRVQAVPLTSNTGRVYPSEALVAVGQHISKAMADQIVTVDKRRLYEKAGTLSDRDMAKVEQALRLQLGLRP